MSCAKSLMFLLFRYCVYLPNFVARFPASVVGGSKRTHRFKNPGGVGIRSGLAFVQRLLHLTSVVQDLFKQTISSEGWDQDPFSPSLSATYRYRQQFPSNTGLEIRPRVGKENIWICRPFEFLAWVFKGVIQLFTFLMGFAHVSDQISKEIALFEK